MFQIPRDSRLDIAPQRVTGRDHRAVLAPVEHKHAPNRNHVAAPAAKPGMLLDDDAVVPENIKNMMVSKAGGAPACQARAPQIQVGLVDDDDVDEPVGFTTELPPGVEDIDAGDHDCQQVAEYVTDIYKYLGELEVKHRIDPNYMNRQTDINTSMRELLVGWMSEVAIEFQLMNETHFLAVNIVDQFLMRQNVSRDKLQLIGMVGMFLAAKYEEIFHPSIEDFVYVSAGTYTKEQLVDMELKVFRALKFDLSFVSSLHFLRRFSKAAMSEPRMHACCKYFLELCLPKYAMLAYSPSMVAASAVYLARMLAGKKPVWNPTLTYYSGFAEKEVHPCVKAIIAILRAEAQLETPSTISEKFSTKDHFKVSQSVLAFYRKY